MKNKALELIREAASRGCGMKIQHGHVMFRPVPPGKLGAKIRDIYQTREGKFAMIKALGAYNDELDNAPAPSIATQILEALSDFRQGSLEHPEAIYIGVDQVIALHSDMTKEERGHIASADGVYATFDDVELIPVNKKNYLRAV